MNNYLQNFDQYQGEDNHQFNQQKISNDCYYDSEIYTGNPKNLTIQPQQGLGQQFSNQTQATSYNIDEVGQSESINMRLDYNLTQSDVSLNLFDNCKSSDNDLLKQECNYMDKFVLEFNQQYVNYNNNSEKVQLFQNNCCDESLNWSNQAQLSDQQQYETSNRSDISQNQLQVSEQNLNQCNQNNYFLKDNQNDDNERLDYSKISVKSFQCQNSSHDDYHQSMINKNEQELPYYNQYNEINQNIYFNDKQQYNQQNLNQNNEIHEQSQPHQFQKYDSDEEKSYLSNQLNCIEEQNQSVQQSQTSGQIIKPNRKKYNQDNILKGSYQRVCVLLKLVPKDRKNKQFQKILIDNIVDEIESIEDNKIISNQQVNDLAKKFDKSDSTEFINHLTILLNNCKNKIEGDASENESILRGLKHLYKKVAKKVMDNASKKKKTQNNRKNQQAKNNNKKVK